jgi:hypothetical protein
VAAGGVLRCCCIRVVAAWSLTRVQEALTVAGIEGDKADLNRVVKTSGEGWSQGQKQLVSMAPVMFCVLF